MTRRDLEGASLDEPLPYGSGPAQRQLVQDIRAAVASEPERPWTVEDAARWLSYEEETVRRWARSGKLRGEKVGKEWRFDPRDVRALKSPTASCSSSAAVIEAQMNAAYTQVMRSRGRTA